MGNSRTPGPTCSTRVGDYWIDDGTLCRAKTPPPLPLGFLPESPAKVAFDKAHVYSLAPEGRRKRAIDLQIIGGDYSKSDEIRFDNEDYLKKLIAIASNGKQSVSAKVRVMQFFIVRGGAEGLLPEALRKIDARNNVTSWTGTDGKPGRTDFDENDLIAVFSTDGTLIGAARLRRPTYVQGRLSRETAARVYDAWANKHVFIYSSQVAGWIPYLGLALDDGFRDGSANKGEHVYVDMHKEEQTNGCIFVVDKATPALGTDALRTFEPTLIRKILAAKGIDEATVKAKHRVELGTMRVVTITL
jgi:hypothetical protein